ncbi:hypothetical protein PC110_g15653 [Phytophthora cactorum]|uniref:Uncharacterized protein n=1 Tax=Phytophthora cactorum TaxID=29920 RepID=A0A329RX25_9STRA|nr:hypothetical protein PC117_g24542 [Phytophthora cactorum]RAW27962.1 hypothetical protein PC110_g15653 [Phytophthora cactorum]
MLLLLCNTSTLQGPSSKTQPGFRVDVNLFAFVSDDEVLSSFQLSSSQLTPLSTLNFDQRIFERGMLHDGCCRVEMVGGVRNLGDDVVENGSNVGHSSPLLLQRHADKLENRQLIFAQSFETLHLGSSRQDNRVFYLEHDGTGTSPDFQEAVKHVECTAPPSDILTNQV